MLESDVTVTGLALDSRLVKPGDLFFACLGTNQDGRQFIPDAIQKGASAILAEMDENQPDLHMHGSIPFFSIKHLNQHVSEIAACFYNYPANSMHIVGITGTNGKTSCAHFLADILHHIHMPCGIMGTLGNGVVGNLLASDLTTPDAITIQKTLAEFRDKGLKYVAMEVSSHSLDQGRVNGIPFTVGIFTNLTREHLDYHHTMEAYYAAKKKLFDDPCLKYAVVSSDDAFGRNIIASRQNVISYSMKSSDVDVFADQVKLTPAGITANLHTPWGEGELHTRLIGQFNISNILAVLTTLCLLKIPFSTVLDSLQNLAPVPGRMQVLGGFGKPLVVVDYSHTPDSLEKALSALKEHGQGKLYCVFGCGGDRDKGKRPLMAKTAEQLADFVIVTDDNPRTEDPEQIVQDILKGLSCPDKTIVQHNRSKAIHDAIQYAKAGDTVLIAGKGAETVQLIGNVSFPFSDVAHVIKSLKYYK